MKVFKHLCTKIEQLVFGLVRGIARNFPRLSEIINRPENFRTKTFQVFKTWKVCYNENF